MTLFIMNDKIEELFFINEIFVQDLEDCKIGCTFASV